MALRSRVVLPHEFSHPRRVARAAMPEVAVPPGVIVRPARPRDARSHVALWTAVAAEGQWLTMDRFDHTVAEYHRLFQDAVTNDVARFAAAAGDDVVGSIRIARIDHGAHRHVASFTMAVALPWRGKGIGAALLHEALTWARTSGVEKVMLDVYASNLPAIALYQRFGFSEEGRLRRHAKKPGGFEDELIMAQWLVPDLG
jgi:RimJ/RimL family protein N-acetyltransferase